MWKHIVAVDDTKQFIEVVRSYQFLYDKQHKDYKNALAKNNRWELIGKQCNMTGEHEGSFPFLFFSLSLRATWLTPFTARKNQGREEMEKPERKLP